MRVADMARRLKPEDESPWRLEFIQPVTPDDHRCVMLYGPEGEIVGPLRVEIAEAWMEYFSHVRNELVQERKDDVDSEGGHD